MTASARGAALTMNRVSFVEALFSIFSRQMYADSSLYMENMQIALYALGSRFTLFCVATSAVCVVSNKIRNNRSGERRL